ncbi:MAG: hypothetical protein ACKVHE_10140 [Planctomycetales bacterium]
MTAQADAGNRLSPRAEAPEAEAPSNAPRIATFINAQGIVPLTGIERLQSVAAQLEEIDAPRILSIQSVDEIESGCRVTMPPVSGVMLEQLLQTRRSSWL